MQQGIFTRSFWAILFIAVFSSGHLLAQENYEIQVYGAETVPPGVTMVELHNNFTFTGSTEPLGGVNPTQSALHETVEITHGFTPYFEIGWYFFTSARSGNGWQWVGDHIRPRLRAPAEWGWPVGVSLSTEFGYQQREFSTDTWTMEIRPIIDREFGDWYIALNPVCGLSFKGENENAGLDFSPNVKVGYAFSNLVNMGIEYYGTMGPLFNFDPAREQEHQIFPAVDLNVSPEWEVNFGVGVGLTPATDHLIAKLILGRRLGS